VLSQLDVPAEAAAYVGDGSNDELGAVSVERSDAGRASRFTSWSVVIRIQHAHVRRLNDDDFTRRNRSR
jgi:hypothetical protein